MRALLLVLGIAVLGAGIGALLWINELQPLTRGPTSGAPGGTRIDTINLGSEYQFSHEPGGRFQVWFSLRNDGPLSVKVTDIFDDPRYYFRLAVVEVDRDSPNPLSSFKGRLKPLDSVVIPPDQYAQFLLTYEFVDCETQQGSAMGFDSVQVRYSMAWLDRVVEIPLESPIGIRNVGGDCGDAAFTE